MTNLNEMKSTELKAKAKELKVKNWWLLKKEDLIKEITAAQLAASNIKTGQVYTEEKISPKGETEVKEYSNSGDPATEEEIKLLNKISKMPEYDEGNIFRIDILFHMKKNKKTPDMLRDLGDKGFITVEGKGKDAVVKLNPKALEKITNTSEDPDNLITLKEIIIDLGIRGTKARRILRGTDIPRPFNRWEWDKEEHADIIQRVIDLLSK